jgi:hypothetical protein
MYATNILSIPVDLYRSMFLAKKKCEDISLFTKNTLHIPKDGPDRELKGILFYNYIQPTLNKYPGSVMFQVTQMLLKKVRSCIIQALHLKA